MKKILLLNGPPHCGKDAAVIGLMPYIKFKHLKFAAPIKAMAGALLDMSSKEIEQHKEDQFPTLLRDGSAVEMDTLRQFLIALSEDFLKPRYGNDFFGRIFYYHARRVLDNLIIASDCGFRQEVHAVAARVGVSNTILIRIHRDGCDFSNDSREYIPDGICGKSVDIHNNLTMHDLTMRVLNVIIREWGDYVPLLREPEWIK